MSEAPADHWQGCGVICERRDGITCGDDCDIEIGLVERPDKPLTLDDVIEGLRR